MSRYIGVSEEHLDKLFEWSDDSTVTWVASWVREWLEQVPGYFTFVAAPEIAGEAPVVVQDARGAAGGSTTTDNPLRTPRGIQPSVCKRDPTHSGWVWDTVNPPTPPRCMVCESDLTWPAPAPGTHESDLRGIKLSPLEQHRRGLRPLVLRVRGGAGVVCEQKGTPTMSTCNCICHQRTDLDVGTCNCRPADDRAWMWQDDNKVINNALVFASESRLSDICNDLGLSTIDAGAFSDRCREVLTSRRGAGVTGTTP